MDPEQALQACAPAPPIAVAYSGGADSTALLHLAHLRWPGTIQAIHVHHGLQAAADDFERHCESTCRALDIPLQVTRVDARPESGQSPEDAARRFRYRALAETALARGVSTVLLAQHADDQVETMLLALSRGAGLPGLAGMARCFVRHGIAFERPFLDVPSAELRSWLHRERIAFVQDPSNSDTALTRNRIRMTLMPRIEESFPRFRETFARSARHAAQAQELLDALADGDLARMDGEPLISALRALPRAQQANMLRRWLRTRHACAASEAQLAELLDQLAACKTRGHDIRIKVSAGMVMRMDDRLAYLPSV